MDKKELKIIKLLDKASGYAGKMQDCLDDALEVALSDKGLTKKEKSLLTVSYATGGEEAVERVNDGSINDECCNFYDDELRDKRILEIYNMTGDQIRELYNL